jgi:hypothetical protein
MFVVPIMATSLIVLFGQAQKIPSIPYPEGYRSWNLVKSGAVFSEEHPLFELMGGIHNVYVNDRGLDSLWQGRAYPDRTVFVFDLFSLRTSQGAMETGERRYLAVMRKDAKRYSETDGWGFELFQGNEKEGSVKDMKPCFDCHASKKSTDYVHATYSP